MDASRIAALWAGALAVALWAPDAAAKIVRYEIDGRTYSYSTNNREQIETARQRIKAADEAAAARAKAAAERASNPLVQIFGSQAQEEAKAAQARLEQILPAAAPASVRSAREERRARAGSSTGSIAAPAPAPAAKAPAAKAAAAPPPARAALTPAPAKTPPRPRIEAVVFDVASGIKTTHLSDGTVQEDLFEDGELTAYKARAASGRVRITVVNEKQ